MKPSGRVERHVTCRVGFGDGFANLGGGQQAAIERRRQPRMEKEALALHHRILPGAEIGQRRAHEMAERAPCFPGGDRQVECLDRSEMVGEALLDEIKHLARHSIRREAHRVRVDGALAWRLAVLLVEVPDAALGLIPVHQQAGLAAHLAVEMLHDEFVPALRPGLEIEDRAEEAVVLDDLHRQPEPMPPALDRLLHAPLAGLDDADPLGLVPADGPLDLAVEAAAVAALAKRDVIDRPAIPFEFGGEVPHRRQDQRDLRLVMSDVGRLLGDLHHQHHRILLRDITERGEIMVTLVAEDGDQDHASETKPPQLSFHDGRCVQAHSVPLPARCAMHAHLRPRRTDERLPLGAIDYPLAAQSMSRMRPQMASSAA